jgi:hypothetical protein
MRMLIALVGLAVLSIPAGVSAGERKLPKAISMLERVKTADESNHRAVTGKRHPEKFNDPTYGRDPRRGEVIEAKFMHSVANR